MVTASGEVVCLDSKVTIDDNALYRHAELKADAEAGAEDREARARQAGLAFVALDGDIGVLGNGAGLVMSTIDQIAAAGGSAADFCDIGGGARAEVVATALDVILSTGAVRALLVSIFGGITRCDEVARGLVQVLGATQRRRARGREARRQRRRRGPRRARGGAAARPDRGRSADEAVRLAVAARGCVAALRHDRGEG